MTKGRVISGVLAGAALAAGLGAAAYLTAGDADKLRPREVPVRVAFSRPVVDAQHSAPARYDAQVQDLTAETEDLVRQLEFTTVSGPVDSHVVWLSLHNQHHYLVRVRAVSAGGAVGPWSEPSDPYVVPSVVGDPPDDPPDE